MSFFLFLQRTEAEKETIQPQGPAPPPPASGAPTGKQGKEKKKHLQALERPRPSARKGGQSDSIILESHGRPPPPPPPPARSAALQRRSHRRASLSARFYSLPLFPFLCTSETVPQSAPCHAWTCGWSVTKWLLKYYEVLSKTYPLWEK